MILQVGDYKFDVVESDEDGFKEIYIGSASRPCLIFLVFPDNSVVLQDLVYHIKCSRGKSFVRRSGATQLMVKAALQWICDTHPKTKYITFTDKLKYDGVMVPEKMMLTEGQTWYQKHFQALPEMQTEKMIYFYRMVYESYGTELVRLPLSAWTSKNIKNTLAVYTILKNKQITGTGWYIPRNTIESYDVPKYQIIMEGGRAVSQRKAKMTSVINEWRRNWEMLPDIWRT